MNWSVLLLFSPRLSSHRHFFLNYHLPKSILRLCWYLLHSFKKSGRSGLFLGHVFFLTLYPAPLASLYRTYFWFLPYWKTKSNSKPTNKFLIPNSPTLANDHAWCSLHSLRYVYQFLIHILFRFIWHLFKLFFSVSCLLIISFSRIPSRFFFVLWIHWCTSPEYGQRRHTKRWNDVSDDGFWFLIVYRRRLWRCPPGEDPVQQERYGAHSNGGAASSPTW